MDKQYYLAHKTEINERWKKRYPLIRNKAIAYQHKYRSIQANLDKIRERVRKYRLAHKTELNKQKHQYYLANRDKISEKNKQYRLTHIDKLRERGRRYYQQHPPSSMNYLNRYIVRKNNHLKVLARFGSKCSNPYHLNHGDFLSDSRCLQIDHINGGGSKERRSMTGRMDIYLLGLSDDEFHSKYQLLCANCNWIKRHINNEQPNVKRLNA